MHLNTVSFSKYKILIVMDKLPTSLRSFLTARGFQVITAETAPEGLTLALDHRPHIAIINLLSEKLNACDFCKKLYKKDPDIGTKALVFSTLRERANIVTAIDAGASDYILMPYDNENLLNRIQYHLRNIKVIESEDFVDILHDSRVEVVFEVLNLLAKGLDPHETLYQIALETEKIIKVKRCSFIAGGQFTDTGFVAASNDDPDFQKFKLDLHKYPEVQQVMHTGRTVVIEDIKNDPIMKEIKKKFVNIDFNSILVAPISFQNSVIGVFSIRAKDEKKKFSDDEIKICRLLGIAAAPTLNRWRFKNKDIIMHS